MSKITLSNPGKILAIFLLTGAMFLLVSGYGGKGMADRQITNSIQSLKQVSPQQWKALSQKKIFFGHQSVGNNIMQGIGEVQANDPEIHLNIIRTKDRADFVKPVFAHSEIGKNDYPLTKIKDFVHLMEDGFGDRLDMAFMKFCFVDINSKTDIHKIIDNYRKSIEELHARYPDMTIIHFTVPLLRKEKTSTINSVKNFVKGIMGKKKENFFSSSHNAARNEYNKLLLRYYGGKEPVFDLAKLESTDPAGNRQTFTYDGRKYYALTPEYTEDGGHLNLKGRKYIAEQLLIFLAKL